MKVTYEFVDGTTSEIDTQAVGASLAVERVLRKSQRKAWATEKEAERHTFSSDSKEYEGVDYGCYDTYFAVETRKAELNRVHKMLDLLTVTERRRAMMLYRGMTQTQIAAHEGVSVQSVNESVQAMRKKLKIFRKKP